MYYNQQYYPVQQYQQMQFDDSLYYNPSQSNSNQLCLGELSNKNGLIISTDLSQMQSQADPKRRSKKSKSTDTVIVGEGEVIKELPSIEQYNETNLLLKETIAQANQLSSELKRDLDTVRSAKNMKGKYTYISNLNSAMSAILGTKLQAIKEMNSSIKTASDMDYKKAKDTMAIDQDNDKAIMDMYNAFIHQPIGQNMSRFDVLGPSTQDITNPIVSGLSTIDAYSKGTVDQDSGYNNYLKNLTPEQNLMRYEGNPDVKQVIIYDESTGARRFAVMNTRTGEEIHNVPVRSERFLSDTTIDPIHKVARNINLNESYPVIVVNEDKMSKY